MTAVVVMPSRKACQARILEGHAPCLGMGILDLG